MRRRDAPRDCCSIKIAGGRIHGCVAGPVALPVVDDVAVVPRRCAPRLHGLQHKGAVRNPTREKQVLTSAISERTAQNPPVEEPLVAFPEPIAVVSKGAGKLRHVDRALRKNPRHPSDGPPQWRVACGSAHEVRLIAHGHVAHILGAGLQHGPVAIPGIRLRLREIRLEPVLELRLPLAANHHADGELARHHLPVHKAQVGRAHAGVFAALPAHGVVEGVRVLVVLEAVDDHLAQWPAWRAAPVGRGRHAVAVRRLGGARRDDKALGQPGQTHQALLLIFLRHLVRLIGVHRLAHHRAVRRRRDRSVGRLAL